jgi:hypothetical protein
MTNGTARLTTLIATIGRRLAPRCLWNSNSRPIWNIRKISPTWARPVKIGPVETGNRECMNPGKRAPSRLGPSRTPARISPDTSVWPIRRTTAVTSRVARRITMS